LKVARREDVWAVVSDFKMPQISGTELLGELRRVAPLATRLMLTGYLELAVVQEAINLAGVFRFVTKPWDEIELRFAVEAALQHSKRKRENQILLQEVTHQNTLLESLTKNLENEVHLRTRGIEESKVQAEEKERRVRELTAFVKELSYVTELEDLYRLLEQEAFHFPSLSPPLLLAIQGESSGLLYWGRGSDLQSKTIQALPKTLRDFALRSDHPEDRRFWESQTGKVCRQLITVPFRTRESESDLPTALIFLEHDLQKDREPVFLDRVMERIQPISIVLDKIVLKQALTQATRQWETTFDGFGDPIAIVDHSDKVIRANKSFQNHEGSVCHNAFDNRDESCQDCVMPRAFADGLPQSGVIRTKKGHAYRMQSFPVRDLTKNAQVTTVVNHYTDVSRERELYFKLVQSEKLAAVGLLAGNIAHELSNPLTGIKALAQILQGQFDQTDSAHQDLIEVEKASERCQQIIRNLLSFSQAREAAAQLSVNVNEAVQQTLPLLKTALRFQNVQTYFAENPPLVEIQLSELQQVIFNLIHNAAQAMPEGGNLTITTSVVDDRVNIAVNDTGQGIPPELLHRIFEPFFTTKGAGVGTGLGLSVCRSILEKYKGELKVESEHGQGSTFTISLPFGTIMRPPHSGRNTQKS